MAHQLTIELDDDPRNPREWDNLGTMTCFHKRYNLGDQGHGLNTSDFDSWEEMENYLYDERNAVVVLPLYLYDHSGLTMSTGSFSCSWDSGQVGFIWMSREEALEAYGRKRVTKRFRALIEQALKAEVEVYDSYLRGDCWGFAIEDEAGEVVESCWGFYSEDDAQAEGEALLAVL